MWGWRSRKVSCRPSPSVERRVGDGADGLPCVDRDGLIDRDYAGLRPDSGPPVRRRLAHPVQSCAHERLDGRRYAPACCAISASAFL